MNKVELTLIEHDIKVGQTCDYKTANIIEDTLFMDNGELVGFYLKDLNHWSARATKLLSVANNEFLSDRVPKSMMSRSDAMTNDNGTGGVKQFSTILGATPPRPHMRRPYPSISSVHQNKDASQFIKAMLMLSHEAEEIMSEIAPKLVERQREVMTDIDAKWKFGNLFTSSISNFNISADFHIDRGNIIDTCNVIFTKRKGSKGGSLNIPDYNATIEQADNSMLVYPAWRNMHGVTPIIKSHEEGYRNSLIFYPLKAFKGI